MSTLLNEFFSRLESLQKDFYPDIFFLGSQSGRSLTIVPGATGARYFRFRIPGGNSLHLESIAVYSSNTDSELVNIAEGAVLTTSSILPGSEDLLVQKKVLNSDSIGVGVHTDNTGCDEWVCLDFQALISPERIVVCNRPGIWAWRAWGLIIECSEDGVEWLELYTHGARLLHFVESARALVCFSPVQRNERDVRLLSLCVDILSALTLRQYGRAREILGRADGISKNESAAIRRGFGRLVLCHSQLAWSGHGILRPFGYWGEEEKKKYLQCASQVVEALSEISPYVCLGFGFVLGYVRDGDLIAHDDDVDILLAFDRSDVDSIPGALRKMEEHLSSAGYMVEGQHLFSHRWVRKAGGKNMDVFVGIREDSRISWYPSARGGLLVDDVFPALKTEIYGTECRLPRNPLSYLNATYGDNWRSPDPDFNHPWDMNAYSDLNR